MQAKVEPGYWSNLGALKLEHLKLEEGLVRFHATYAASNHAQLPSLLSLAENALEGPDSNSEYKPPSRGNCLVLGTLYCLNTLEQVVSANRDQILSAAASSIWSVITDGSAEKDPSLLQHALMIAYCDLKQYKYHYWLGYVPVQAPQPYTLASSVSAAVTFGGQQAEHVMEACQTHISQASGSTPFFILGICNSMADADSSSIAGQMATTGSKSGITTFAFSYGSSLLTTAMNGDGTRSNNTTYYLAMLDPSNISAPGWPLQNALLLAAARWKLRTVKVLCLRQRKGRCSAEASLVLEVDLPEIPSDFVPISASDTAWELNSQGPVTTHRTADLSPFMDPILLASSAVDLNLKLMTWRAITDLDIAKVAATRCLLLGAGTLGCSVARALLGWGVRKLTFLDNSKVSYSNPVRQSLYLHEDCLHGGKPKAQAAADAVQRIFPGVDARGVNASIPMPGHPPSTPAEIEQVKKDLAAMDELIQQHDAVFLLLDTRESRWLPALLCAVYNKLAITAALGFDGFVVMRHGTSPISNTDINNDDSSNIASSDVSMNVDEVAITKEQATVAGVKGGKEPERLGCYFCNDVIAPANSTRGRAMDQQCTVARPGLSGIAGSLATEMMVAVVQHPMGSAAPAAGSSYDTSNTGTTINKESTVPVLPLGDVPHMIRGQLNGFSQTCMRGQAYSQCTACSARVVESYKAHGQDFVLQALIDSRYLEELTGLAQLKREFDAAEEKRLEEAEVEAGTSRREGGAGTFENDEDDEWEEL